MGQQSSQGKGKYALVRNKTADIPDNLGLSDSRTAPLFDGTTQRICFHSGCD